MCTYEVQPAEESSEDGVRVPPLIIKKINKLNKELNYYNIYLFIKYIK